MCLGDANGALANIKITCHSRMFACTLSVFVKHVFDKRVFDKRAWKMLIDRLLRSRFLAAECLHAP